MFTDHDVAASSSFLKEQVSKFNLCVQQLITDLQSLADGQSFVSMKEFIHDVTTDVISQVNVVICIHFGFLQLCQAVNH